jgi:hypothetical protein
MLVSRAGGPDPSEMVGKACRECGPLAEKHIEGRGWMSDWGRGPGRLGGCFT